MGKSCAWLYGKVRYLGFAAAGIRKARLLPSSLVSAMGVSSPAEPLDANYRQRGRWCSSSRAASLPGSSWTLVGSLRLLHLVLHVGLLVLKPSKQAV
jgi:hypothetical protein